MDETHESMSGRKRNLIVIAVMIIVAVIAYFGFSYDHAINTADAATTFAENIIRNSPVVNSHLGTVTTLTETQKKYTSGSSPKVQLAFDVVGAKGDATVTMNLERVNNNIWSIPEAQMNVGGKNVSLR